MTGIATTDTNPGAAADRSKVGWHRSMAWEVGAQLLRAGLQIPSFVLVSRLLAPGSVGTLTLLTAVLSLALTLYDSCLVTAVLQAEDRPIGHRVAESMVIGGAFGAVMALIALGVAIRYPAGWPAGPAAPLCLIPVLLLTGLNSGHTAVLIRARRHRDLAVVDVVTAAAGTVVGLLLLVVSRQFWSVCLGFAAAQLVKCVLLSRLPISRELDLRLDAATRRALLHRLPLPSAAELLGQFSRNADYLAVSLVAGTMPLAGYSRAFQLTSFPAQFIGGASARVSMGTFSRHGATADESRQLTTASRSQTALATAAAVGLVLLGPWLLTKAAGPAYIDAGPVVQLLALAVPVRTVTKTFSGLIILREPAMTVTSLVVLSCVVFLGTLAVATSGTAHVAAVVVGGALAQYAVCAVAVGRALGSPPWHALWPPLAGSAAVLAVLVASV